MLNVSGFRGSTSLSQQQVESALGQLCFMSDARTWAGHAKEALAAVTNDNGAGKAKGKAAELYKTVDLEAQKMAAAQTGMADLAPETAVMALREASQFLAALLGAMTSPPDQLQSFAKYVAGFRSSRTCPTGGGKKRAAAPAPLPPPAAASAAAQAPAAATLAPPPEPRRFPRAGRIALAAGGLLAGAGAIWFLRRLVGRSSYSARITRS